MRKRLDFLNIKDTQICLPAVILKQRVIIRTEVFWDTFGRDGSVEHPAQGNTVYITSMYAKADDAACKLIHDHKDPVAL